MRIGTRLTAGLLLALTPLVAGFTYWHVQRSTQAYISDLKREIRATANGLAPALASDLEEGEQDQVADILRHVGIDGSTSAVFTADGRLQSAAPGFPQNLIPNTDEFRLGKLHGSAEFEHRTADGRWFGRLELLPGRNGRNHGYLLVAQDWSNISDDLRERTMGSAVAGLLVILATSTIVPLMVRRYVSGPLAELSQKVMGFSKDEAEPLPHGDELLMLTEEFRRLDQQLSGARKDLLGKHQRELELERKLERAGRLATIGTLASGLAHEIGTPLGVIRGRAEFLLGSKPAPAKTEDGLRIIVNQIDRISRIVRMLLDYAREHTSQRILCDARTLVDQALGLMEMEASARDIRMTSELGDKPLMIECDPYQMQQVLINLVVNALDAMDGRDDGILRVVAHRDDEPNAARVMLTFADNGGGIAVADQPRVFDPFFSTKEPGKGTGMGLAVTQSIVRDHRGEVSFASDAQGTRFMVIIPLAVDTAAEPERAGERAA
jgi:two-component system, NtrC family, sensor kinase